MQRSDGAAVDIFADNLKNLLLAAPLGGVVRRISAAAEAQAWRDENAGGSLTEGTIEGPVDTPTFLTPAGLVQVWDGPADEPDRTVAATPAGDAP